MLLSKAGYYADFVVYPLLLLPLGIVPFLASFPGSASVGGAHAALVWGIACAAGLATYSLLEYTLHRHVLHRVQPFRRMHDMHHRKPAALVGTPTWLSAAIILAFIFLPFWWQAGLNVACGLTFGLIVSYLWYVLMHHAVHRWPSRPGSWLHRARRRHGHHHRSSEPCNFGVTTAAWDHLFGTARER
jgi:sterol desaturase/sphingolipid hydroxylase (fatty acid hydroxylase superfamily)